jgi:uncharacterized membrane protein
MWRRVVVLLVVFFVIRLFVPKFSGVSNTVTEMVYLAVFFVALVVWERIDARRSRARHAARREEAERTLKGESESPATPPDRPRS